MAKAKLSEYVMVAEAAKILGVSQGTIRAWAEEGKIPMHKNPANGYRLFRRADLDEFLRIVAKPAQTGNTRNRKTSS
jgi:excisionase family DNA binding protein